VIINWQEYKPKLTALNIALGLFLLSFTISTFVGVDPYHSFWDNHERMLGLFTIFHYVAYYFVCSAVFKKWEDWRWALRIFLGAATVVMCLGIVQIFNPDFLLNGGGDRIASTLGNSVYVGGYALFVCFVSVLLSVKEPSRWWKVGAIVCGLLGLVGLFFSGSRGALFGFLVGSVLAIVLYSLLLKDHPRMRKGIWGIGGLLLVCVVVLFVARGTTPIKKVPALERLLNTSYTDVRNSARFIAWERAVESWKEKPVFGWGPNNFFYAFNKYYDPRSLNFGYGETWFDNAHNILVNTLAVQGIVGLAAYLSIFGAGFATLFISYRKKQLDVHVAVVGAAFLLAHLVQNVTVFENPTSYLYFMFWLAMISSLSAVRTPAADRKVGWTGVGTAAVSVVVFIFIFNIQPARANQKALSALRMLSTGKIDLSDLREVITFPSPHVDDIRTDIARGLSNAVVNFQKNVTAENKDQLNSLVGFAFETVDPNLKLHPLDIRNYMMLAQIAQSKAVVNNDEEALKQAEAYLAKALVLSPKRQQVMFILAQIKLQLGKNEEALKMLEDVLASNDRVGEAYWRLAYAYGLTGNIDKAQAVLQQAKDKNIHFTDNEKNIINELETQLKQIKDQQKATSTKPTAKK
jgi:O-antigen ligase